MENLGDEKAGCGGRREFLVKASALVTGGLLLNLSSTGNAQEKTPAADEAVLKLNADSPLNKAGGFDTIETKAGKIVVVRTDDTTFKAYSAICPHKNGPITYDAAAKDLVCPWHGSRFDLNGKVTKGPARTGIAAYTAENEVLVSLTPKT